MDGDPTSYDIVAYPANIFPLTHPDHLAVIARLHGLDAPPVATARVLEIGGGDGVNLIAAAAAYPEASFFSFDLSSVAVARGKAFASAAGLTNIRIEVADILDAAVTLAGPFDYVIAHGVYAWVPGAVRRAIMALVGRVLAREGVAFISYNALPGGHLRRVVRDLLLHHVGDIADPAERVARARDVLIDFATPRENDRVVMAGIRDVARPMLRQEIETLYHDELSPVWAPQALTDVVAAANAAGLGFLNDASPALVYDGLPGKTLDDAAVVRDAQTSDFGSMVFFHQTLLVHAGRQPARSVCLAALPSLFVASKAQRSGPDRFKLGDDEFAVGDSVLADGIEALGKIWPRRLPVSGIADTPDRCEALFRLFAVDAVSLHSVPMPGVAVPGPRPVANPAARAQIAAGAVYLFTLDHRMVAMPNPGPRAFMTLLDGSRDRARLAADWAASAFGGEIDPETALHQLALAGFILH